jgi:hypothetical protein
MGCSDAMERLRCRAMKTFFSLLVSILVSTRQPVASTAEDVDRYTQIAEVVLREAAKNPLWGEPVELQEDGEVPAHVAATATLLWAIAYHESGLRQSVRDCRVAGDNGRSMGLFQLMKGWAWQGHSKEEICGSDEVQARLALALLHRYRAMSPHTTPMFWINGYASGNGGLTTQQATGVRHLWERFSRRAGIEVFALSRTIPRKKTETTKPQLPGAALAL